MSKSNLFKKAHAIAKTLIGDYSARLSMALKLVWVEVKNPKKESNMDEKLVKAFETWKQAIVNAKYKTEESQMKALEVIANLEKITEDFGVSKGYSLTSDKRVRPAYMLTEKDLKGTEKQLIQNIYTISVLALGLSLNSNPLVKTRAYLVATNNW